MNQKYLFLDYDGTLLPSTFEKYQEGIHKLHPHVPVKDSYGLFFSPGCIYLLGKLLDQYPMDIVVTSRWNTQFPLDGLQTMWLERGYPGQIVGTTTPEDGMSRGYEIEQWLVTHDRHVAASDYLILDDMGPSGFYAIHRERLVCVKTELGFTTKDLAHALALLR